jgi:hypothetical protein
MLAHKPPLHLKQTATGHLLLSPHSEEGKSNNLETTCNSHKYAIYFLLAMLQPLRTAREPHSFASFHSSESQPTPEASGRYHPVRSTDTVYGMHPHQKGNSLPMG